VRIRTVFAETSLGTRTDAFPFWSGNVRCASLAAACVAFAIGRQRTILHGREELVPHQVHTTACMSRPPPRDDTTAASWFASRMTEYCPTTPRPPGTRARAGTSRTGSDVPLLPIAPRVAGRLGLSRRGGLYPAAGPPTAVPGALLQVQLAGTLQCPPCGHSGHIHRVCPLRAGYQAASLRYCPETCGPALITPAGGSGSAAPLDRGPPR